MNDTCTRNSRNLQNLCVLQDIIKVTDFLARHLHRHGDELLMAAKPVALSVNEMFSITKRLKLPFDALGVGERVN